MNNERVKLLEEFYRNDPNDPFNLYALALEFQANDTFRAANLFETLLKDFPDYLPTYYQAVDFFSNQNDLPKAMEIAKKGIEKARYANELKTLGEISSLLEALED